VIDPSLRLVLNHVADALGDRRDEFVFLGGAVTGLLVTDPAAAVPRPTDDVDVIVDVGSYRDWSGLVDYLRARGWSEDPRGPICRFRTGPILVDVMPAGRPNPLGFSNRWYPEALASATKIAIADGCEIRIVSAVAFLATKLEAFNDGRRGDHISSHDLEDVIAVIDGRPSIVAEVLASEDDLGSFVRDELRKLLAVVDVRDVISGHLAGDSVSQARAALVLARLGQMATRT
jgi:predicted nucleotidyltransferase